MSAKQETARPRIRRALKALNAYQIVGRSNYLCCQSCGVSALTHQYPTAVGYAFYHEQDAEHLSERGALIDGGMYLSFGAISPRDPDRAVSVGLRVAEALRDEGLVVDWDGNTNTRIRVTGVA
jgi:hypothetical protein